MIEELCKRTGFTLEELNVKSQRERLVYSRFIIMEHLVRIGYTLAEAGEVFGRHHATVYHGLGKLAEIRETKYPKKLYDIILRFEEGDEATREKKILLLRFFLFFRDRGEDYLGLTMEQFIDKFIEFEKQDK